MKKFLSLFIVVLSLRAASQIGFTMVDPLTQNITIHNYGASTVDISAYRFCGLFEYDALNSASVSVVSGNLILDPAEEVTVHWAATSGFNTSASDVGLYLSVGAFSDPANMVAFMEYGAGGQGRENVAVAAGIWSTNTFVSGTGPFIYTGNGSEYGAQFWTQEVIVGTAEVVINEVDCDTQSTDVLEFIELIGEAGASLDGLVIVFFNGNFNNLSYAAFDLDGYTISESGFFVIGNALVPNVNYVIPDNTLQNGVDGIGIYVGNAVAWPNDSPPSTENLVDAVVYGTDDPVDQDLLDALTPGLSQLNETPATLDAFLSLSRVPDGGEPLNNSSYVLQIPTPGASNSITILCSGGSISDEFQEINLQLCSNEDNPPVNFTTTSTIESDTYYYVVTDELNNIILISQESSIDLDLLGAGPFRVWGLSFTGTLDPATTEVGMPATGILSDDCVSLSGNYVFVAYSTCFDCEGGSIAGNDNLTYFSICLDGSDDLLTFATSSVSELPYTWFLADEGGLIISELDGTLNGETLPAGTYYVWGISYEGELDASTTEAGDALNQIQSSGPCVQLSSNSVQIITLPCTLVEGCTELFFSEYFEGPSFDKALEIYNPTNVTVDLSEYGVYVYNNGATEFTSTLALTGSLEPGGTYIISNSQANPDLLALADIIGNVALFNGDDAIELRHNDNPIDVIGVIGQDPGTEWTFGTGSTLDRTLVRKPEVQGPEIFWTINSGQWLVYPVGEISFLGNHASAPCSDVPLIGFSNTGSIYFEDQGVVSVTVQAFNIPAPAEVTIDITAGSAIIDEDFSATVPTTLSFPAGSSTQTFEVLIIDDLEEEVAEFVTFGLTSENEVVWFNQFHTVSIEFSDPSYDLYDIAEVTTTNTAGVLDSANVFCELRGIVHGINWNPSGLHFHLIDDTDGIKVFSAEENLGYTVAEGDSIHVLGQIIQFHGQAEIRPDQIVLIDGDHPLETPEIVTTVNESHESHLVTITCVTLSNDAQWTTGEGSGFTVTVTDGANSFDVWIDQNTDLFEEPALQGHFTLTGIVEQDDELEPFDQGYRIWPRYIADVTEQVVASFNAFEDLQYGDDGAEVNFDNNSVGAVSYTWDFGDESVSSEENPTHTYDFAWLNDNQSFVISLVVSNQFGCNDSISQIVDAFYVGIDESSAVQFSVFPNPFTESISLISDLAIEDLYIHSMDGSLVYKTENGSSKNLLIDLSPLSAGVYVLRVQSANGMSSVLLIKE